MAKIITMPRFYDKMKEGKVSAWHKKVGDNIKKGDILAEIDTDKATLEFETFTDGILLYIANEGENLTVDGLLAIIGHEGEDISAFVSNVSELDQKHLTSISPVKDITKRKIFIGHGRSKLWAMVDRFLYREHGIDTLVFENESRVGNSIIPILEGFLDQSSLAILIMTAEDETAEGKIRARQNVIHEAGLFQGKLGFDKVIILKQNNVEEFSNIAGLQYIGFSDNNIEHTFYEIHRKLKQLGMV